jgi:hypothetical protein
MPAVNLLHTVTVPSTLINIYAYKWSVPYVFTSCTEPREGGKGDIAI